MKAPVPVDPEVKKRIEKAKKEAEKRAKERAKRAKDVPASPPKEKEKETLHTKRIKDLESKKNKKDDDEE